MNNQPIQEENSQDQQKTSSSQEITCLSPVSRRKNNYNMKQVGYQPYKILMELTPRSMLYLHGDFVLCFYQLQNEDMCRKFHHNNMFRSINYIRIWKPHNDMIQADSPQSSFVEAVIEKSYFSKQDYIGIAENLVYHGRKESEFLFGSALMQWHQHGQKLIQSIQQQNEAIAQAGQAEEFSEQESNYKNELMELVYKMVEKESTKGEFFQYNIVEMNRATKQYETTRIGISKGLSCLLGADEGGSQSVMIRNGTFEYLDNRTNLRILRKQLLQCSKAQQNSQNYYPQATNTQFYNPGFFDVFSEDEAILHTLDDFSIPCKVIQYNLDIKHNLHEKYPNMAIIWQNLIQTLGYLPYPDLISVEVRFIEVEAYALDSLLQLRYKAINLDGSSNLEHLMDEIGYSIRSIYFIEKFYENKLESKKKRYRRKKGHIDDWEYLQHKYDEYKKQQEEKLQHQKQQQEIDDQTSQEISSVTSINKQNDEKGNSEEQNQMNNQTPDQQHHWKQVNHNHNHYHHNNNINNNSNNQHHNQQQFEQNPYHQQNNFHQNNNNNQHHHNNNSNNHHHWQSNQINNNSNFHSNNNNNDKNSQAHHIDKANQQSNYVFDPNYHQKNQKGNTIPQQYNNKDENNFINRQHFCHCSK